jgi:2,3-bisphosphoglycerate-dependent phosphoglycerate mutase
MAVGLKTGPIFYTIGTGSFMHSFFSTIAYHLEAQQWGSKFPVLMSQLYSGEIQPEDSKLALDELKIITEGLSELRPDQIIWDIEDLTKQPPWGNNIANAISSMANYFVTSDGKPLLEVFETALETSIKVKKTIKIHQL